MINSYSSNNSLLICENASVSTNFKYLSNALEYLLPPLGFLCLFLGSLGIHNFFLGFIKKGILEFLLTLVIVGGIGSLLFFFVDPFKNALAYILPFLPCFLFYAFASIRIFKNDSLTDANGVFLR